jgi:hypothetical protein
MKTIIIGLMTATILTSCYKERTCQCKNAQGELLPSETMRKSKKDAQKFCDDANAMFSVSQGGSCELK